MQDYEGAMVAFTPLLTPLTELTMFMVDPKVKKSFLSLNAETFKNNLGKVNGYSFIWSLTLMTLINLGICEVMRGNVYTAHINLRTAIEIMGLGHKETNINVCYFCRNDAKRAVAADEMAVYRDCPMSSYVGFVDVHIYLLLHCMKGCYQDWIDQ
jgi:hypothetical protein